MKGAYYKHNNSPWKRVYWGVHSHTDCYQCIACLGHSCSVERKTQQNQTKIAIQKTDSGLCQAQLQRQVLPKIPLTVADFWVSTVHLLLKISQFRKEKKAAITPPHSFSNLVLLISNVWLIVSEYIIFWRNVSAGTVLISFSRYLR